MSRFIPFHFVFVSSGEFLRSLGTNDAAELEEVKRQVEAFESKTGRRPRVLIAKMGQDGHDRGAKVRGCF